MLSTASARGRPYDSGLRVPPHGPRNVPLLKAQWSSFCGVWVYWNVALRSKTLSYQGTSGKPFRIRQEGLRNASRNMHHEILSSKVP